MPSCLFQHHFQQALIKAGNHLKSSCQDEKASEDQKDFNITKQIPLMIDTLAKIVAMDVNEYSNDWTAFREAFVSHLDNAKSTSDSDKITKQSVSAGSAISNALSIAFCNKMQTLFDETRKEINLPIFLAHGNQPSINYIDIDYNKSPFINQLIHIALDYRFNKIQVKVVTNSEDYTDKHKEKWVALTESIELWVNKENNPNSTQIRLMKRDVSGLLNQLIVDERNIQNEVKTSTQTTSLAFFKSVVKAGLTLVTEENDSLGNSLQRLRHSYLTTSDFLLKSTASAQRDLNSEPVYTANSI